MDQFYLPTFYVTKVEWSDLPLYIMATNRRVLCFIAFYLEVLVCLLPPFLPDMRRLTFDLVNDHFNSLGHEDSVVAKKFLFNLLT